MPSNLPPSAEEEVILRARLKEKTEELTEIHESMAKARIRVAFAELLAGSLSQSSERILKTCDGPVKHTSTSPGSLQEQFFLTETRELPSNHEINDTLYGRSGRGASKGGTGVEDGTEDLTFAYVDQNASLQDVKWGMRRHRLLVTVTCTSLKIYSFVEQRLLSEIREISGFLGSVRRIPDEIWYEILGLRIARDTHYWPPKKFKGVFLPSLPLSHVCSAWRRVVVSSPSMWRSIHWNLNRGRQPNQELLELWASRVQDASPRIYERLRHSGLPTGALTHIHLGLPSHQKIRYYIHQDRSLSDSLGPGQPTADCSFLLIRQSKSSTRVQTLQRRLLKMFPAIETLCLEGVTPKQGVVLPESLSVLVIGFYGPHPSYSLAHLLVERLTYLKLVHFTEESVPYLDHPVRLPNLVTLQISPLEHDIVAKLILPNIESLRIFPQKPTEVPNDWLDSLIPHCANLRSLSLDGPTISHSHRQSPYDRLGAFRYLRAHTSKLRTLCFHDGSIDGSGLADFLESARRGVHSTIEELTIESCTGVSRMDCDRLVGVVNKLNVYRSFHSDGKIEQQVLGIMENDVDFVQWYYRSSRHVHCSRLHQLV